MPVKMTRRPDDGAPDKMSTFQRINTEFGAWKSTTTTTLSSSIVGSEEPEENYANPKGALAPSSTIPSQSEAGSTASARPCKSFKRAIPRYSQMDTFIEGLDAACEALPTPLVGSASAPPPPPQATLKKDHSSAQQHCHHQPQPQQSSKACHEDCPLSRTGGIVKEVKFADEVIEIGRSLGGFSAQNVAHESREPPAIEMADSGTRVSRAMRFDYKKRRSDYVKAATVVQSTYRGYKVRRGQPIKYLLVISSVKERLEELRQQFDAWKIAAWFPTDLTERVTMTESVMDLLVQLDSLQGVPVVVREFRKNVARDVIKFQEEVDGFLCRNSKHGVLFDLTRQEGKATQGSSTLKPSKAIRNIVVQDNNLIENDNSPQACRIGHNGSRREDVMGGGNMTSTDDTSECGSDCQSKNVEVPLFSVCPPSRSGQDFILWSPEEAEFEKLRVGEKSREEKQPESITELKKCVASTNALNIYMQPDRKKKLLGPRYGILHFANKDLEKEHLSIANECPHAPLEDNSLCRSTSVVMQDMPHASDVSSMDFTRDCQKKEDSKLTVSINTERSLDTIANGRNHICEDFRIIEVRENLEEDRAITHPHTLVLPDNYLSRIKWESEFPHDDCKLHEGLEEDQGNRHPHTILQPDYSSRLKWESEYPSDDCKLHDGLEEGQGNRYSHIVLQPGYSSREMWEAKFSNDVHCDNLEDKGCSAMEDTSAVIFEPPHKKNNDTYVPVEVATSNNLYDDEHRYKQTKLHAFPSRVEYVSAIDVREGTIEPLLPSHQKDKEMSYLDVTKSQFNCSSKGTFPLFDEDNYIDSSRALSEGNRIGTPQNIPNGLAKEGDPCHVVFSEDKNELHKFQVPGSEAIMVGQFALPKISENAPLVIPSPCILKDNIREQLDKDLRSDYEPCGFEDLETSSSCSNCATCPDDSSGEPWDLESGVHEQMPHQSYALKGLVRELDEVFIEQNGEGTRCFEADYWKDQAWRDISPTKFQQNHDETGNSLPNFQREVEVQREESSLKTFRAFEYDELQCFQEIEQSLLADAKLASSHDEDHPNEKQATCLESKPSNLPCTSHSLVQEMVASSSTTSVPHEGEGNILLTKLVEDNKRLKELLKEVMKWNTFQASAMITLNERLELVESKRDDCQRAAA